MCMNCPCLRHPHESRLRKSLTDHIRHGSTLNRLSQNVWVHMQCGKQRGYLRWASTLACAQQCVVWTWRCTESEERPSKIRSGHYMQTFVKSHSWLCGVFGHYAGLDPFFRCESGIDTADFGIVDPAP